jgi:hypothetical protein
MVNINAYKRDEDNELVEQEQLEDLNQTDRVPEFDEIGTALNGI